MDFVNILLASHRHARRQHLRYRVAFWAAVLGLALGILLFASSVIYWPACGGDRIGSTVREVQGIADTVRRFKAIHTRCPASMAELRTRGFISRDQRDPWGRPYVIVCSASPDLIRVCSRGRDGLAPICNEAGVPEEMKAS
jgi:hypothetical protein